MTKPRLRMDTAGNITRIDDGFQNLVANLGTARDKAFHSHIAFTPMAPQQLEAAYQASKLAEKIVDIPAEDAFREWREWQAEKGQIELLEAEEQRLDLKGKLVEAGKAARLHGGSAIFIGTGEQNLAEPLNPESVNNIEYLTVLGRYEVAEGERETDPRLPEYGKPKHYRLSVGRDTGLEIHPSRLAVFRGSEVPCSVGRSHSWGNSDLEGVMQALLHFEGTMANIASLVFEAKIDVVNIKDFTTNLRVGGTEYEKLMLRRFGVAAMAKGNNGTLLLDGEEEYTQKSASFATLPDIADRFMQVVAAAASVPMTILFGTSPKGLNATGENDVRAYYDRVKVLQSLKIDPAISVLNECLIRSALGSRPPEIHYNWRPLWQPTAKEKADVGKVIADTMKVAVDMDAVSVEAAGEALVNGLTEVGAVPGLESAVDEFGLENDDD